MSERLLVSVVTGTWQRHDLLLEAIENVRAQTYRPLEMVIVSDGPDERLAQMVYDATANVHDVDVHFAECGRHWSSFLAASMSTAPFLVAQLLARGPLQMWLADDERMTPDHIESLVDLLETTDSDFVYPRVRLVPGPGVSLTPYVIGTDPPMFGTITHALYRAELLDYRMFTFSVGSATDWDQIAHWMAAGARWAMLDRVTLSHRLDKLGEGDHFRAERQPLRGHKERVTA